MPCWHTDITLLNYGSNSTERCRYLFLLFSPRCHLSGQYLRDTPQPCRLDKPTCKKPLVSSFSPGSCLPRTLSHSLFRSSILCVLIRATKRRRLLMPSSPFPRAPGMAFAFSPKHSPCAKFLTGTLCPFVGTASVRSSPWLSCESSWRWLCSGFAWRRGPILNPPGRFAVCPSWSCVRKGACGCRWSLWRTTEALKAVGTFPFDHQVKIDCDLIFLNSDRPWRS